MALFAVTKLVKPLAAGIKATDVNIPWPLLSTLLVDDQGKANTATTFAFSWLSAPGAWLFIAGVIVAIVYSLKTSDGKFPITMGQAFGELGGTIVRMGGAILTIVLVLALAYVMNFSGQTKTIGVWLAGTGGLYAFLSPILGWLGTAVTGSDTSANALFASLQGSAATNIGMDPNLAVSANTTGCVVGKLISPQNLAIAATAVNLPGQEGRLLRRVLGWSVLLLLILCILVYLQSTPVLSWMLAGIH